MGRKRIQLFLKMLSLDPFEASVPLLVVQACPSYTSEKKAHEYPPCSTPRLRLRWDSGPVFGNTLE
jgi:hypothetical protein